MRPVLLAQVLEREFHSTDQGHHTPVMLWGPPGVGKSQMVAQVAKKKSVPLIDIRLSQMEPSDLRGIPFRQGELVEWAIPAMLPDTKRHASRGILFLDEISSNISAVSNWTPTASAQSANRYSNRRLSSGKGFCR